jgi:hypothetical protein
MARFIKAYMPLCVLKWVHKKCPPGKPYVWNLSQGIPQPFRKVKGKILSKTPKFIYYAYISYLVFYKNVFCGA